MKETLSQKQRRFFKALGKLNQKIHDLGYEATQGDGYRDPRVFGKIGEVKGYGNAYSCHKLRLAVDINLFKEGVYLETTEAHRKLGEWWESLAPDHCWGGRFDDGSHYSITHEGVK